MLAALSNKLSKIVSKNDSLKTLEKLVPNEIWIERRSMQFFRIPLVDMDPPIKIRIMQEEKSDYVLYVSKNDNK